jgi:DNA-binding CsgD family transcriptional regulator
VNLMDIQRLLIWICFAICLGLTAGGVLIFFRLKEGRNLPAVRFFQYYLVMIYAFGYYAIWSDVFIQQFFSSNDPDAELVSRISNLLYLISTPFLLIGLIMLLLWVRKIVKKTSLMFVITGIVLIILISIFAFWQLTPITPDSQIKEILTLLSLSAVCYVTIQLYFSGANYLNSRNKLIMTILFLAFGCIQYLLAAGFLENFYVYLGYLFLFFLLNTTIGALLVYTGEFPDRDSPEGPESFSLFVEKYGITAREEEVIKEIYKGKTNREIADTLFITTQTVKDHTHRIYQKTDVRNRNQLTSLLRKLEKQRDSINP